MRFSNLWGKKGTGNFKIQVTSYKIRDAKNSIEWRGDKEGCKVRDIKKVASCKLQVKMKDRRCGS